MSELTDADRKFLYEARNTDFFKIFHKAVQHLYMQHCSQLTSVAPEKLLHAQGVLVGLAKCRSLLTLGTIPEENSK